MMLKLSDSLILWYADIIGFEIVHDVSDPTYHKDATSTYTLKAILRYGDERVVRVFDKEKDAQREGTRLLKEWVKALVKSAKNSAQDRIANAVEKAVNQESEGDEWKKK